MQRLSTEDVPSHQRLAFVHDVVGRHAAGMTFNPLDRDGFRASFSILPLNGRVVVGQARYDAFAGARPRELLADGRDDYQLLINEARFETEIDSGATLDLAAGDLLVLDQGVHFTTRVPASRFEVVTLPKSDLAALVPGLGARAFRAVRRGRPGLGLLAGYADLLRREPPVGAIAAEMAAQHLLRLAALTLAADPDESAREHAPSLRAAKLAMLKKYILGRLDDPELGIAAVARRHGISPRYVQMLFAQEGSSLSDFIRAERLDRAFRRLGNPKTAHAIAGIAFEAGFADLSTFNRAFRRRYGCTPSDVRAQAIRARYS